MNCQKVRGKSPSLYLPHIEQLGDALNYLDDNAMSKARTSLMSCKRLGGVADRLDYQSGGTVPPF